MPHVLVLDPDKGVTKKVIILATLKDKKKILPQNHLLSVFLLLQEEFGTLGRVSFPHVSMSESLAASPIDVRFL